MVSTFCCIDVVDVDVGLAMPRSRLCNNISNHLDVAK
jgi:hypothetical protein